MGNNRFRSIMVAFLLIVTVALAGVAVYVGYKLQGDQGADITEASGQLQLKFSSGDCTNDGCTCKSASGCEVYYFRCPGGWVNGICLSNKTFWRHLSNGQSFSYSEVTDEPTINNCDYVQIDMDPTGYGNLGEGTLGYALFEWTGDPTCEPVKGCGDGYCNAFERTANKCETFTIPATGNKQAKECKTLTNIDECRSDCTWCGDGKVQADAGEECDPGDASSDNCTSTCKIATEPSCGDGTVDTGEECDYAADPTGCSNGETCTNQCACESDQTPSCGDGQLDTGEECETGIACTNSNEMCNLTDCTCNPIVQTEVACEDITRVGTDNVGENEIELFNVLVSGPAETQPYATNLVKLRVSSVDDDTPVGEDFYTGESLVAPVTVPGYNPTSEVWTYTFAWIASDLTNGQYEIEVSFDGGNTWDATPVCSLTFTYDADEVVEPSFLIVKESTVLSASSTGGAEISYTLTVTNLGPVEGVIDYVEDELDSRIQDGWVSNIASSRGVSGTISNGVITWLGTEDQRTFAVDESATYSYDISIPAANMAPFMVADSCIANIATAVYGDNQVRYNLCTPLDVSETPPGQLPSTGIFDNTPWIIATFTIILGLVAYRLRVGDNFLQPLLLGSKYGFLESIGLTSVSADEKQRRMEKMLTRDDEKGDKD